MVVDVHEEGRGQGYCAQHALERFWVLCLIASLLSTSVSLPLLNFLNLPRCSTSDRQARQSGAAVTQKDALELSRKQWLAALSSPERLSLASEQLIDVCEPEAGLRAVYSTLVSCGEDENVPSSGDCVLGIDPDVSGAVAVLRGDTMTTAEVFDVPSLQVMVGARHRRRHDAWSIVGLINGVNAPHGSVAYIEQSQPVPKDGKQGWWGSGFGFGMWIGILVACGYSVVPVPSPVWKRAMDLTGRSITKDDCRASAALMFPSLAPQLRRKKDHGRAEALLIAAYGKGIPAPVKEVVKEVPNNESFPVGLVLT